MFAALEMPSPETIKDLSCIYLNMLVSYEFFFAN